jgi:hypothetical protein
MQRCITMGDVEDEMKTLLLTATGERSMRAIAVRLGMEPSTLNRQAQGDMPVRTLVAICRAYGIAVVPMFVEVGYITADEAREGTIAAALETASDAELMSETLRRVQAGKASRAITAPMNVGDLTDDELRDMPLPTRAEMALAAGDDKTTDDEDTSTP